ncbi:hypothetical protein CLV88_13019 [Shimia abyssi]|uniref:Uncharacterized protein n=1 Tax=Shimia abyssi TaxID=1662395 RepID=A0A2P8EX77_9RHOB|nr:hypothetical protein CLV88_13019 [Shimia abyssi]
MCAQLQLVEKRIRVKNFLNTTEQLRFDLISPPAGKPNLVLPKFYPAFAYNEHLEAQQVCRLEVSDTRVDLRDERLSVAVFERLSFSAHGSSKICRLVTPASCEIHSGCQRRIKNLPVWRSKSRPFGVTMA